MLVTFSGLDGAGKSTLIGRLRGRLEREGLPVTVLTVYDHASVYALLRGLRDVARRMLGRAARVETTDSERLGVPQAADTWLLRVVRSRLAKGAACWGDVLVLAACRLWFEGIRGRVLILDRYIFDSLADISDGRRWGLVRAVLAVAPRPNAPVFIDVPPEEAFARKGEYSVAHLRRRRGLYRGIFARLPGAIRLANLDLDEADHALWEAVRRRLPEPRRAC